MLSKVVIGVLALCAGVMGQSPTSAGTPASVAAAPTATSTLLNINSDPLLNNIYNYYANLFNQSDTQSLVNSIYAAAQTDLINYAAAQPSAALAELPGLLDMFNAIFASETDFYPKLIAAETSISGQISSIAQADAAEPTKLVGDLMSYVGTMIAEPTFTSFLNSLLVMLPTAAGSYLAASPSLVLASQLPLILTAVNPVFTSEPFYPSLLALESKVQVAMTSIVSDYSVTKMATPITATVLTTQTATSGAGAAINGSMSSTTSGTATRSTATTTLSINTFKGEAAPTGALKALAAMGGMLVGVAALL